jgi:hypothetical protein
MDRSEVELFDETLRRTTEAYSGPDLDGAIADLGWLDALAEDHRNATSLLFERQGEAGAASSAIDDVVGSVLGVSDPGTAVLLPGPDSSDPPAVLGPGGLTVDGLASARILRSEEVVVVVSTGDGTAVAVLGTSGLTLREVAGIDRWIGLVEVAGTGIAPAVLTSLEDDRWTEAVRRAHLALGHELVGAASTMVELARAHARDRVQFGRPIGSFQAVQHRLAEALCAVESARAVLAAGWDDGSAQTALMAKALAGRGGRAVARHGQQVLAGIGFTTEHPLHRYVRRVLVLDELFGSSRSLTAALGRRVLTDQCLPPAIPL